MATRSAADTCGIRGKAGAWRPLRQLSLICVLLLLLPAGCARLLLTQLDTLVVWYVDGYVDLTSAQEREIRAVVRQNLTWFRTEEAPQYVALLRRVGQDIDGTVTPELVAQRYARAEALWNDLRTHLVPDVVSLTRTLTDEQVEEFFEALAEDNEDLAEKYSGDSSAERRARQDRQILKSIRRICGRLSDAQEAQILARTSRFHDLSADWLERRAAWQGALRKVLERRSDVDYPASMANLLKNTEQFDSADYRQRVAENRAQVFSMLAELSNGLTPKQRQHFQARMEEYAGDVAAIAVQPLPPGGAVKPQQSGNGS